MSVDSTSAPISPDARAPAGAGSNDPSDDPSNDGMRGPKIAGLLALLFAWFAATAWMRPLLLPDEGRYVGVAREMLQSGDWIIPTLNGLPFFHKPPLFYWITAASMSVFGVHEFAARLAPLLGACLGAVSLFLFLRRWAGPRLARLSVLVLAVQPLWYLGGQFANMDMPVAACIGATILLLADAALRLDGRLPWQRPLLAAYAVSGIGVLAKGLIGFVLPALVVALWLLVTGRGRTILKLLSWRGAIVFLLITAPWFVLVERRYPGFGYYFFVVQHFKRFAAAGFNNAQPVWFYGAILLVCCLPWLHWLYRAVARSGKPAQEPIRWLMLIWTAVITVFFSMPQSKPVGYILPVMPALACLIAIGYQHNGAARWWRVSAVAGAVLSVGAIVAFAVSPQRSFKELGQALSARRHAGEPVMMLGWFYYDVPFYARLDAPVMVEENWGSEEIERSDKWNKELQDAGGFAPRRASELLVPPQSVAARLCRAPRTWVIGPGRAAERFPFLKLAQGVEVRGGDFIWKVEPAAPGMAAALRCQ